MKRNVLLNICVLFALTISSVFAEESVEIIPLEEPVLEEEISFEIEAQEEVETFDHEVVATTSSPVSLNIVVSEDLENFSSFEIESNEESTATTSLPVSSSTPVLENKIVFDSESIDLLIRNGADIIVEKEVALETEIEITIRDTNGVSHTIPSNSVLGILAQIDKVDVSFEISDIQYYESFGALYLKCIVIDSQKVCDNWQYVINNVGPWTSIDASIVSQGDSVGLYFGSPYQVVFDTSIYGVGVPITAHAQAYNYQTNTWNPRTGVSIGVTTPNPLDVWNPIVLATYSVGLQGEATFTIATSGLYTIGVAEDYYYPSYPITVSTSTATTTATSTDTTGGGSNTKDSVFDVDKAISFLKNLQAGDGSYGGAELYTDWVAIAFGSVNEKDSSLMSYLENKSKAKKLLTDNERRAMALLASNKNPYDFEGVNYIEAIVKEFDGTQFGEKDLVNDDIFALIVLSKVGYKTSDVEIKNTIDFILEEQRSDGSWEQSVDLTAASVQALSQFKSFSGVSSALSRAKAYLKNEQETDGGWGSVYATSWALQAMNSLSENWEKDGNSPEEYLADFQQEDGGVLVESETEKNRIWATSYAIPAVLGKSWGDILNSVSRPVIKSIVSNNNSSNNSTATSTATSTGITEVVLGAESEEVEVVASTTLSAIEQTFVPQKRQEFVPQKSEKVVYPDQKELILDSVQKNTATTSQQHTPWFKSWWTYMFASVLVLVSTIGLFLKFR